MLQLTKDRFCSFLMKNSLSYEKCSGMELCHTWGLIVLTVKILSFID